MEINNIPKFLMSLDPDLRWKCILDFCMPSLDIIKKYLRPPWRRSYREKDTYSKVALNAKLPRMVFTLSHSEREGLDDISELERELFFIISDIENDVLCFKRLDIKYAYLTVWNLLVFYKDLDSEKQLKLVLKLMLSTLSPLNVDDNLLQQHVKNWHESCRIKRL